MNSSANSYLKSDVHPALVIGVVAVAFFALGIMAIKGNASHGFAPLWYGDAVATLGLLLLKKRFWVILLLLVALAIVAGNVASGFALQKSFAFVPGNLLTIFLSALLVSRQDDPFRTTVSLPAFLQLGFRLFLPLSAGAVINSAALSVAASQPMSSTAIGLFLSDLNGYVAIIPLGYAWFASPVAPEERAAFTSKNQQASYGSLTSAFAFLCGLGMTLLALFFATWPFAWLAVIGTTLATVLSFRLLAAYLALTSFLVGLLANHGDLNFLSGLESHGHGPELMATIALVITLPLCVGIVRRSERLQRHMSEQKSLELQRERQKLATLFEDSPNAYLVIATDRPSILDCNRAAETMLHAGRDELIGSSIADYEHEYQPNGVKTLDLIESALTQMVTTGKGSVDMLRTRRDGSVFWVNGCVSRITYNGKPANLWVWIDISERQRLLQRLGEAREAAEKASLAKGQFLSAVSHELRTPLNSIMGMFELVMRSETRGPVHEFAARGFESSEHLLQLINEILDLSSIEAGRFIIKNGPFRMAALVDEVVAMAGTKRTEAVEMKVSLDGSLQNVELFGDALRLKQVLINILGNALKFTDHGSVVLSIHRAGGPPGRPRIEFSVKDTGIGLTPEQQAQLFQPFMQVDASSGRRYGGSGLGLAISQRLVTLMGGDAIIVDSQLGVGSQFAFHLALPVASPGLSSQAGAGPGPSERGVPQLPGYRLLLVEDDETSRFMLRLLLESEGASVEEAGDGAVAVELALSAGVPYDVVLMDSQMPVKSGMDATRELRARGYSGAIIALSASAFPDDREAFLEAGASGYVTKPVKIEDLSAVLRRST